MNGDGNLLGAKTGDGGDGDDGREYRCWPGDGVTKLCLRSQPQYEC